MKINILNYIISNLEDFKKSELKGYIGPILSCLTDKNKEVRGLAEKILEIMVPEVGIEHFRAASKDLKPAFI